MEFHFQKSIFGNLVPNGPYIEVLPKILLYTKNGDVSKKLELRILRNDRAMAILSLKKEI